jgi:hypothetical protein
MEQQMVVERAEPSVSTRDLRPSDLDRATFLEHGFVELPDLFSPLVADAMATEARRLHARAVDPTTGPRTPVSDERRTGKVTRVATGSVLHELHSALAGFVRALSGQMLLPSIASYGYFPDEDGVILHRDSDATDIVLLTTALGQVGPLSVRPELKGCTPAELGARESDPAWDRDGGQVLHYPAFGVAALRGAVLPHHRVSQPVPELSAVAALHYRSAY